MISDSHVHTLFSGDSDADIDKVIQQAIQKQMPYLAITDHHDFYIENNRFVLDLYAYDKKIKELQKKYSDSIQIIYGIELGLDNRFADDIKTVAASYDYDFIIGSSHVAHGIDPYYTEFFEGRSVYDAMVEYFESIIENLELFDNFDIYGHIDYAIRYAPGDVHTYRYDDYRDLLDTLLKTIIKKGKGIEINTSNLRKGLTFTNPTAEVIKRYRALGGEIITVGSDSHNDNSTGVGAGFDTAAIILNDSGFKHYNVFINRKPVYLSI